MKVKTDSGCSLIEYDTYFKESEYKERKKSIYIKRNRDRHTKIDRQRQTNIDRQIKTDRLTDRQTHSQTQLNAK